VNQAWLSVLTASSLACFLFSDSSHTDGVSLQC
jgi:hypothetical protein